LIRTDAATLNSMLERKLSLGDAIYDKEALGIRQRIEGTRHGLVFPVAQAEGVNVR
jgi:hypothetical protein